ncbi:hypothetical protein [Embleya sp. NBC_00896]|uniref:hypothetical protein n=1 Tax=Embleya sp. NBC_00896 TaxID=2975961 RepID=UPI002F915F0B|nr:hypothetical protein OG928_47650 [Embleya sp. NBC_00896]
MHQPHPAPPTAAPRPPWLTLPRAIGLGIALACLFGSLSFGLRGQTAHGIDCGSAWLPEQSAAQRAYRQAFTRALMDDRILTVTNYKRDCTNASNRGKTPAYVLLGLGTTLLIGTLTASRRQPTHT